MKKMDEFADNETLSNKLVTLYKPMLLSCKDAEYLFQMMNDYNMIDQNIIRYVSTNGTGKWDD